MKRALSCFFILYACLWGVMAQAAPRLLIKIPTRSRPEQFFSVLDTYYAHLSGEVPYQFLITCDSDDLTMNCPHVIERLKTYPHLSYGFYNNKNKIEAYNRDVSEQEFDILLVTSDDMLPVVKDFDKIIVEEMASEFPDFDGVLNFHDGHVGGECNTLPVIGARYYERFGYIYHPDYTSLYCDEEFALISKMLNREKICNTVIIQHRHPVWGLGNWDALYSRNENFKYKDFEVFTVRKRRNFDLMPESIKLMRRKKWSILICTLDERAESFGRLYRKLEDQITQAQLNDQVEILFFKDNRHYSVGYKRNSLLAQSTAEYVNFIDDDDDVHDRYVPMIYEKLLKNPDCVSLTGIMTTRGSNPQRFVHSLATREYTWADGAYRRPPNHLNPIKRGYAIQCKFPDQCAYEDTDWALQLSRLGLLKYEEVIDEPYYFYYYDGKYPVVG